MDFEGAHITRDTEAKKKLDLSISGCISPRSFELTLKHRHFDAVLNTAYADINQAEMILLEGDENLIKTRADDYGFISSVTRAIPNNVNLNIQLNLSIN